MTRNGKLLLEWREWRYLRFRDSEVRENWVGTARKSADVAACYDDSGVAGWQLLSHRCDVIADGFTATAVGRKPLDCDNSFCVTLTAHCLLTADGTSDSRYRYELTFRFYADTVDWYDHSVIADAYRKSGSTVRPRMQLTDYHIEQVCLAERSRERIHEKLRYPYFVSSSDGHTWEKFPKIHIPYPTRNGNYCTIRSGDRLRENAAFGFADSEFGGWVAAIRQTSAPITHEICWCVFDVHIMLCDAVPLYGTEKGFSHTVTLDFCPLDKDDASALLSAAKERDWRSEPVYQVPFLTKESRFDRLITDIPSEETAYHMVWWSSDDCCFCRRNGAVILRKVDTGMPSAWSTYQWKQLFTGNLLGRRFRVTAIVDTVEADGEVRLVHAVRKAGGDFFYGWNTHTDGRLNADSIDATAVSLSGTHTGEVMVLDFTVRGGQDTVLLEMNGCGECCFRSVRFDEIPPLTDDTAMLTDDGMRYWFTDTYGRTSLTDEGVRIDRPAKCRLTYRDGKRYLTFDKAVSQAVTLIRWLPLGEVGYSYTFGLHTEESAVIRCGNITAVCESGDSAITVTVGAGKTAVTVVHNGGTVTIDAAQCNPLQLSIVTKHDVIISETV